MPSQAVAILRRDEVLAGLAEGKRLSDLNLGVSPQAISKALRDDQEYRDAMEAGYYLRLDAAEKAIEDSVDSVDVARARARFQSVGWRAEREFPARWGARPEQVAAGVTVILRAPFDGAISGGNSECDVSAVSIESKG